MPQRLILHASTPFPITFSAPAKGTLPYPGNLKFSKEEEKWEGMSKTKRSRIGSGNDNKKSVVKPEIKLAD
ncbi:hypothetical protein RUM43_009551 [Polyplax serrata]|uniref:Uncharacterized protein n=1 Tax=Polyplax serrata TaxID=468196 RepID=A0AAN8PWM0_POLSC